MCFVPRPRDDRRRRHARVRVKAVTATPRDTGPRGATGHTPRPTRPGHAHTATRPCGAGGAESRLDLERVDEGVRVDEDPARPDTTVVPWGRRVLRHGPAGPRGRLISFNRRKPAQNVWIFSHRRQKDRGNAAGPQRSLELACVWQRSDRRHQNNERRNYPPPPQIHRSREHRWAAISGRGCQDFTS